MNEARAEVGPCHDPSGWSFVLGDRVCCAMPCAAAAADFKFARSTAVLRNVDAEGLAIAKHASEPSRSRRILDELRHDLEHPRRPFVSYPNQCA
jgi:hypothetical protein